MELFIVGAAGAAWVTIVLVNRSKKPRRVKIKNGSNELKIDVQPGTTHRSKRNLNYDGNTEAVSYPVTGGTPKQVKVSNK